MEIEGRPEPIIEYGKPEEGWIGITLFWTEEEKRPVLEYAQKHKLTDEEAWVSLIEARFRLEKNGRTFLQKLIYLLHTEFFPALLSHNVHALRKLKAKHRGNKSAS